MSRRFDTAKGPSQRQLRVGELIRRALAEILARGDVHNEELARTSITVGEVRCTPDLRRADVFVSPLGGAEAEATIAALNAHRSELRRAVSKSVTLKYSPELKFIYDRTFDQMDETRRLLDQQHVRQDLDD